MEFYQSQDPAGHRIRVEQEGGPALTSPTQQCEIDMTIQPRISILFCTQCNWMLRSAWMAQELMQTFGTGLGEVALIPSTGGRFEIRYNGSLLWERKRDGGFPGPKELKQLVRDAMDPARDLGHVDR